MKRIIYSSLLCVMSLSACMQLEDAYDKYVVPGGYIYPQKPTNARACSGDSRVILKWDKGNDPSIAKAVVSWNNWEDSREFVINGNTDNVEVEIDNLAEKDYSFQIQTFDAQGNNSVPVEVNSQAYGELYKSSIYNREITLAYVSQDKLIVEWNDGDISNGLQYTELRYKDAGGEDCTLTIDAEATGETILNDYMAGTELTTKSYYRPDTTCVDLFETEETITEPLSIIDRSDWTITASSYEPTGQTGYGGANPERVLDGLIEWAPNANADVPTYWHSQHTGNAPGFPHWLAVDMKKPINIKRVVLQCRNDPNCTTGYSFSNFTIQGSKDGESWVDLETYDVYSRTDKNPQYYPVNTKEYYTHFKIVMNAGYSQFADLCELAILGVEQEAVNE